MPPDSLQISKIKETQDRLFGFIGKDGPFSGDEIGLWISDCVVHFSEIGVPGHIIQFFLERMEYREMRDDYERNNSYGPFMQTGFGYQLPVVNRLLDDEGCHDKMMPLLTAFRVAENLISKHVDQSRLVSLVLISELKRYSNTKAIGYSLEAVQNSYEKRDTKSMLAASISATEGLLNLIPELDSKKKIGEKFLLANSEKQVRDKYSMKQELLWSLNNARIIRNYDTHEPAAENETTIFECASYIHILNLLVCSVLSSGELVLVEE